MKKPTALQLVLLLVIGFVMINMGAVIDLGSHAWYIGDVFAVVGIVLSFLSLLAWVHWYFDALTAPLNEWILNHTIRRWFPSPEPTPKTIFPKLDSAGVRGAAAEGIRQLNEVTLPRK